MISEQQMAARFAGRKALITGGLGFIGSHLSERLVALGAEVTIVDNLAVNCGGNSYNIESIRDSVRLTIADLADEERLPALIADEDYIFNLAGETSHLASMTQPFTDFDVNCRAQLVLLEMCRRHNPGVRIIYASTRQIYGRPDYLPVDERHPLRPVDVNGINKLAGESYHLLYQKVHGIHTCALRLTNTIGPRMRVKDARQTFLGLWIRCIVQGVPFEVWDGQQLRDFTYVDDAVEAFLLAAADDRSSGEIFNLCGDGHISLRELAERLRQLGEGGEYRIRSFPDSSKAIDIGDYYASGAHIDSVLGWRPKTSLDTALWETLKFYRCHIEHYL